MRGIRTTVGTVYCMAALMGGCNGALEDEVGAGSALEAPLASDPPPPPPPPPSPRTVQIPGSGDGWPCDYDPPIRLHSLDEAPSGLSAREVLALTGLAEPIALEWHPVSSRGGRFREIEPPPAANPEPLTVDVTYEGGAIHYRGPEECARLDVEVAITLQTPSGALNERAAALLYTAVRPSSEDARIELVLHPLHVQVRGPTGIGTAPVAVLHGELEVERAIEYPASGSDPDFPEETLSDDGRLAALVVSIWFDRHGAHGVLDAWLHGTTTGKVSLASEIATFGL